MNQVCNQHDSLMEGLTSFPKRFISLNPPTQFTMAKRIGVVGITKAENAQLGLLLKYIFTNDEVYNSLKEENVLSYPDAFTALCARYSA